mmetsp:Transcript_51230/g.130139  ORF Transcript_51230/g.130139 Transcript_51230/m.130139 type:complete len:306 (+) Transcript_51230:69-986(+)
MPVASLNGATLWYDDWGPAEAEPLIFHHGCTGYRRSVGYFEGGSAWLLAHDVAPGAYRCIFVEARGCNDSRDASGPYSIAQQALDVLALADMLELHTFSLCGHSMGGGVGWQLLASHSDRIRRMVLLAPVPARGFPKSPGEMQGPRQHVLQHFGWLPKYTIEAAALERQRVVSEGRRGDTEEYLQDRARMLVSVPEEYWTEAWLSMRNLSLETVLPSILTPVLVIAGASDELLRANVEDSLRLGDGVLHVLSGAGHEVARDDPLGVARAIHGFFTGEALSPSAKRALVERRLRERGHGSGPDSKL